MTLAVTAIDRAYLPGLIALHNSICKNSPETRLACIVYGDEDLANTVEGRGIEVLRNPELNTRLPTTDLYPVGNPAMYCRLMIPKWFDEDAVWLDADQVVLKPLDPLFSLNCGEYPCAAVESTTISHHVHGLPSPDDTPALYAGLILMKRDAWLAQRVTERCFELMQTSTLTFRFVVQSVLSFVLRGGFHRLDEKWQRFGNRTHEPIPNDACVVHWHGHSRNPWMCTMANQNLWEQYA